MTPFIPVEKGNDKELIESDPKLRPQYTKEKKSQHEVTSVKLRQMINRVSSPFHNRW